MALIRCLECNKEISENAKACPNCGNPIELSTKEKQQAVQEYEKQQTTAGIITVVSVISILLLIYACASWLWNGLDGDGYLKSKGIDTSNNTVRITAENDIEYEQWKDNAMNWLGFEKKKKKE